MALGYYLMLIQQAIQLARCQSVAVYGADAAPYFRIFNPIMQELGALSNKYIHKP
jgi:deoxyribodipyrimidine photolyase